MAAHEEPWDVDAPVPERTAVTAHWMLGRLAVVQASTARLQRDADLDPTLRDLLLDRSRTALADLQAALEDMARGIPPLMPTLHAGLELRQLNPAAHVDHGERDDDVDDSA